MSVKLKRYKQNPIISPNPNRDWESLVATNPCAWYDDESETFTLIYRCAGNDDEHKVHLGMATSKNGLDFNRVGHEPLFSPPESGHDMGCMEDPRIVKFGDDYFITYASRPMYPGKYWIKDQETLKTLSYTKPIWPDHFPVALRHNITSTNLLITRDFKKYIRAGRMTDATVDDRDVIIFPEKIGGKFYTLHRPMGWTGEAYGTEFPGIWIAACDDLLENKKLQLLAKAEFDWECKIGGSTPPLRTAEGWLTLYHAVGPDKHYRVGAMLLDLDDPTKVLYRGHDWLMQPETESELNGFYNGVVFPCGNIIREDTLFVYYGVGDVACGVATCSLDELLGYLKTCPVGS